MQILNIYIREKNKEKNMTIGGELTVTNSSAYENFTVSVPRNLDITNFRQREMGKPGDIHTMVKNGRSSTDRISQDGDLIKNRGTLDLRSKRYAIFDALRKLDGNENDFTEKDLAKADSLKGKMGITDIKRDANAGVTTVVCEDGAVLRFDFETKEEQTARETKEAQKKAEADAKKQKEAAELKNMCKSDLEKLWDKVCSWFN